MRTIAILLILVSHSSLLVAQGSNSTANLFIRFFGTLGVDVFFVLSGYLIGSILLNNIKNNKTSFRHLWYFWIRRWFKTLPNYFLILLVNILLLKLVWGYEVQALWHYFFFLQNFSGSMPDFFLESWSLSIEEFSYIIGPIFLYALLYLNRKREWAYSAFLAVTVLVIVIGFLTRLNFNDTQDLSGFYDWSHSLRKVVVYRIDSIYYGFLGAYIAHLRPVFWKKNRVMALILGIFLFIILHGLILFLNLEPNTDKGFFNLVYLPILMLSILCSFPYFCGLETRNTKLKRTIEYISLSSYAIYLLNYSIVLLLLQYFFNVEVFTVLQKFALIIVFWNFTFILSYFLYTHFERPIMQLRDKAIFKSRL